MAKKPRARQEVFEEMQPVPPPSLTRHQNTSLKRLCEEAEEARIERIEARKKAEQTEESLKEYMHKCRIARFEYLDADGNSREASLDLKEKLSIRDVKKANAPEDAEPEDEEGENKDESDD